MERPEKTNLSTGETLTGNTRLPLYSVLQEGSTAYRIQLTRDDNYINIWEEELDDAITYLQYCREYIKEQRG